MDGIAESNTQLREIAQLAEKQVKFKQEVEEAKAILDKKVKQLKYVEEVLLPNAMAEAEMSSFTLESGAVVSIKRDYAASISEFNWPAAKAWLTANDGEGVIKHVVTLSFGKGEDKKAEEALKLLIEAGFAPADEESIHPQTLKATVKEYLSAGADIPLDIFGVFEIVRSKVVLPKK